MTNTSLVDFDDFAELPDRADALLATIRKSIHHHREVARLTMSGRTAQRARHRVLWLTKAERNVKAALSELTTSGYPIDMPPAPQPQQQRVAPSFAQPPGVAGCCCGRFRR